MRWIVTKTSDCLDSETPPVEGCYKFCWIKRKLPYDKTVWCLDDVNVVEFVKQHGNCVVSFDEDDMMSIEIYDTYRE